MPMNQKKNKVKARTVAEFSAECDDDRVVPPVFQTGGSAYYHNLRVLDAIRIGLYDILDVIQNSKRVLEKAHSARQLTNGMLVDVWVLLRGEKYRNHFEQQVQDRSQRIHMILALHARKWSKRQEKLKSRQQQQQLMILPPPIKETTPRDSSSSSSAVILRQVSPETTMSTSTTASPTTTTTTTTTTPSITWRLTSYGPTLKLIREKLEAGELDPFDLIGNSLTLLEHPDSTQDLLSAVGRSKDLLDLIFVQMRGERYRQQFIQQCPTPNAKMEAILKFYHLKAEKKKKQKRNAQRTTSSTQQKKKSSLWISPHGGEGSPPSQSFHSKATKSSLYLTNGPQAEAGSGGPSRSPSMIQGGGETRIIIQVPGPQKQTKTATTPPRRQNFAGDVDKTAVRLTSDFVKCRAVHKKLQKDQVDVYQVIRASLPLLQLPASANQSVTQAILTTLYVKMRGPQYEESFLQKYLGRQAKLDAILKVYDKKMRKKKQPNNAVSKSPRETSSMERRLVNSQNKNHQHSSHTNTSFKSTSIIRDVPKLSSDGSKGREILAKLKRNEINVYDVIQNSLEVLQRPANNIPGVTVALLTLMFTKMRGAKYEQKFLTECPTKQDKIDAVLKLYHIKKQKNVTPASSTTAIVVVPDQSKGLKRSSHTRDKKVTAKAPASIRNAALTLATSTDTKKGKYDETSGSIQSKGRGQPSVTVKLTADSKKCSQMLALLKRDEIDVYELIGNSLATLQREATSIPAVTAGLLTLLFTKMHGKKYEEAFLQKYPSKQEKLDAVLALYQNKIKSRSRLSLSAVQQTKASSKNVTQRVQKKSRHFKHSHSHQSPPQAKSTVAANSNHEIVAKSGQGATLERQRPGTVASQGTAGSNKYTLLRITNNSNKCKMIADALKDGLIDIYDLIEYNISFLEQGHDRIPCVTKDMLTLMFVKMRGEKYEARFLEEYPSNKDKLAAILKLFKKKMKKRQRKVYDEDPPSKRPRRE